MLRKLPCQRNQRSFENTEAWGMLSCSAAVFVVFAVLTVSTTRVKCWCKQA